MKKTFFLLLTLLSTTLFGEIQEIHEIMEVEKIIGEPLHNDLILFDIDYTLTEPKIQSFQMRTIKQNKERYLAELDSFDPSQIDLVHLLMITQGPNVLTDARLAPFIRNLQRSNALILGLTGADTSALPDTGDIPLWRASELKRLGVDFLASSKRLSLLKNRMEFTWFPAFRGTYPLFQDGILYCNFTTSKGEVLAAFLNATSMTPSRVVLVDDDLKNLRSVEEELAKKNIPFLGLHYRVRAEKETSQIVADTQWKSDWEKLHERADRLSALIQDSCEMKEFYIKVRDGRLFCRKIGIGSPLVILHGGPGVLTQDYFLPAMTKLAQNHTLIFYDQRGSGKSEGQISTKNITVPQFVEDLDCIRKACGYEKISVLGHSWGGFLAMHYAIEHEKSVDKMILSNSMPGSTADYTLFLMEWIKRMEPYQDKISAIEDSQGFEMGDPNTNADWLATMFPAYCFDPEKSKELNLCMSQQAALNGRMILAVFSQNTFMQPFDLFEKLQKVHIPTLIVQGEADVVPIVGSEHLHENIADSKYILMEKCGHFPHIESPDLYFSELETFLKS
jgi:proline iminopeptidase